MATPGWTADVITEDFPGLGIVELHCAVANDAAKRIKRRMLDMDQRVTGSYAGSVQLEPVPKAYRTLARQLGLDPDVDGTPLAQLIRDRIWLGKFPPHGTVTDAMTITLIETGVPVFALPVTAVSGGLGLMTAMEGEYLPGADEPLPEGAVVVSDMSRPLALAMLPPPLHPAQREGVVLYALRAPGVADLVIEEALWLAAGLLQGTA